MTSIVANTHLDLEIVKANMWCINNDITLRYDATTDYLIDVSEGIRKYMPCIYIVNKIIQITLEEIGISDKFLSSVQLGIVLSHSKSFSLLWKG